MSTCDLASPALSFALVAVVLTSLSALVLNALFAFGLRVPFNRRLVDAWLKRVQAVRRDSQVFAGSERYENFRGLPYKFLRSEIVALVAAGNSQALFSLTYAQLMGQISDAVQANIGLPSGQVLIQCFAPTADAADLDSLLRQPPYRGSANSSEQSEVISARQRVLAHAQRGLDSLQSWLSIWWLRINYLLAFVISIALIESFARSGAREAAACSTMDAFHITTLAVISSLLVPIAFKLAARIARFDS